MPALKSSNVFHSDLLYQRTCLFAEEPRKSCLVFFLLRRADGVGTEAPDRRKAKRVRGIAVVESRRERGTLREVWICSSCEKSAMSKCCGCIDVCATTETYQPLKTHTYARDTVQESFRSGREVLRSPRERRRKPSVRYDVVRTPGSGR